MLLNVLAITTFNRCNFLKCLISSFKETAKEHNWQIIIADDGSTDGTLEYLESLKVANAPITIIKNNRQGVHHQFNTIVRKLEQLEFNYCFKCDDDIEFLKQGWDDLYIKAIEESGYDHLCHFDSSWRPEKNLKKPVEEGGLISYCKAKDVQGAFFTLTPAAIKKTGYMDVENFGLRGVGHIDYTMRACRAGFNDINHPFDVKNSKEYIGHQKEKYSSAMNPHIQNALESDGETKKKYELIQDNSRIYIPYCTNSPSLTLKHEKVLLQNRLETLEKEKQWYEETYGHQPRWFVRLGKLLKLFKSKI